MPPSSMAPPSGKRIALDVALGRLLGALGGGLAALLGLGRSGRTSSTPESGSVTAVEVVDSAVVVGSRCIGAGWAALDKGSLGVVRGGGADVAGAQREAAQPAAWGLVEWAGSDGCRATGAGAAGSRDTSSGLAGPEVTGGRSSARALPVRRCRGAHGLVESEGGGRRRSGWLGVVGAGGDRIAGDLGGCRRPGRHRSGSTARQRRRRRRPGRHLLGSRTSVGHHPADQQTGEYRQQPPPAAPTRHAAGAVPGGGGWWGRAGPRPRRLVGRPPCAPA